MGYRPNGEDVGIEEYDLVELRETEDVQFGQDEL